MAIRPTRAKSGYHKESIPSFLPISLKFFIVFNFFRIKTVNTDENGASSSLVDKIVSQMYSIEAGRFHANDNVLELMIISKDISNHFFNNTCTFFSVFQKVSF